MALQPVLAVSFRSWSWRDFLDVLRVMVMTLGLVLVALIATVAVAIATGS